MTDELIKLIQVWDGQGVYMKYDKPTDTWFFIALHDPTLGYMAGGCRMKVYPTPADGLRDAMRLGRGMTHKWAAIDFHFGGGKSVIALSHPIEGQEREALLRRFGRMLRSLNGAYVTGVDLGTSPEDMAIVREAGKYVFGGEGHEDPGPFTALGVFSCIETTARHALGRDLNGVSVLIQGVGDVGEPLARMLAEAGAKLILSDLDQARASKLAAELGGSTVDPDKVPDTECDILAPSAVGATLNKDTIPRLRCRAVAGSANNQLEEDADAQRLHERGILYAPDYIVNAGGAMAFALFHEGKLSGEEVNDRIRKIGDSLDRILGEAKERNESPVHAATRRVEQVLGQH
ncbi:MAG: hypothetical protein HKM89_14890 [Gemmatimonadales bacterium]|nr:hypothetical protein [Gemmatimonadales bacterium]